MSSYSKGQPSYKVIGSVIRGLRLIYSLMLGDWLDSLDRNFVKNHANFATELFRSVVWK